MAMLAAATLSGCNIVRKIDPIEAHPDVLTVLVMLVGGESEARLLAAHPHRQALDPKPSFSATLIGPGWAADFTESLPVARCNDIGGTWWVPTKCVGATLPEPIRPGILYRLTGTAPLGTFRGRATIPMPPVIVDPKFAKGIPQQEESGFVELPMAYSVGSDVGTVLADVQDIVEKQPDGSVVALPDFAAGSFPAVLASRQADTISVLQRVKPLRFMVTVLGVGWTYTNFAQFIGVDPLPRPWPDFGLTGKGVYGYFAGKMPSEPVEVHVGIFDDPDFVTPEEGEEGSEAAGVGGG